MSNLLNDTKPAQQDPMQPGVTFYQVLAPLAVRDAAGNLQFQMFGPFQTLEQATQHATTKPGSLVLLNVILLKY